MNHLEVIRQLEADRAAGPWQCMEWTLEPTGERIVVESRMQFQPAADQSRAHGYWALAVVEGTCDGTTLEHVNAVVFYEMGVETPISEWRRAIFIDRSALRVQRMLMEQIISGHHGLGFARLERLVSQRGPTRFVPINFDAARTGRPVPGRPAAA